MLPANLLSNIFLLCILSYRATRGPSGTACSKLEGSLLICNKSIECRFYCLLHCLRVPRSLIVIGFKKTKKKRLQVVPTRENFGIYNCKTFGYTPAGSFSRALEVVPRSRHNQLHVQKPLQYYTEFPSLVDKFLQLCKSEWTESDRNHGQRYSSVALILSFK